MNRTHIETHELKLVVTHLQNDSKNVFLQKPNKKKMKKYCYSGGINYFVVLEEVLERVIGTNR